VRLPGPRALGQRVHQSLAQQVRPHRPPRLHQPLQLHQSQAQQARHHRRPQLHQPLQLHQPQA